MGIRGERPETEHGSGGDDQRRASREEARTELGPFIRLPHPPVEGPDELRAYLALPFVLMLLTQLLFLLHIWSGVAGRAWSTMLSAQ
jgi:hypothetical protein